MQILEKTLHWIFAFFVTVVALVLSMVLMAFVGLKLAGAPMKPGADFHYEGNATLTEIYVVGTLCLTLMGSSYLGVITAPYRHRKTASYVFPIFVFLSINAPSIWSESKYVFSVKFFMETAGSCAAVWLLFYYKQRRKNLTPPVLPQPDTP